MMAKKIEKCTSCGKELKRVWWEGNISTRLIKNSRLYPEFYNKEWLYKTCLDGIKKRNFTTQNYIHNK